MSVLTAGVADDAERSAKVAAGARMLVVFLPQVVLYGAGIVLTGILQAHRRFVGPALAPLLSSVVVIGAYLLFAARTGPHPDLGGTSPGQQLILSVGTTAGVAALALSLALPVSRLGLGLRPALRLPAGVGARLGRLSLAGAAGVVAQQLSLAVVLYLANPQPGSVVVYQSAFTVFLLPWAVLAVPISVTAFPNLAGAAETGDEPTYSRTAAAGLRGVILASLAAAAVLVATSLPVARLLLGLHGDGGPARVGELRLGIVSLAPGLVGYGVLAFVTRALYARRLARVPAVATVTGFAAVVATDLLLVRLVVDAMEQPQWRVAALGLGHLEPRHGGFQPGDEAGVDQRAHGIGQRIVAVLLRRQQAREGDDGAEAHHRLHRLNRQIAPDAAPEHQFAYSSRRPV